MLLCLPGLILAQIGRSTITGTVTDASGAVIPGAEVVATQISTGVQFKAVSNSLGFYSVLELPIGTYRVSFHKAGFKDLTQSGIDVETQHTLMVNAVMQVGSVAQTVHVSGTPVLELQTEEGSNLNAREMTDLPLSVSGGRDITSFAFAITPNVSGNNWTTYIGGSQAHTTGTYIDGTSTDSGIIGDLGEEEPSMDAVQEAQVDTAGLNAADGRTGGGAFLYELKSGTNHFHGSTFGFLDNAFLNANSWDNNWYLAQCSMGDTACQEQYKRPFNSFYDYGVSGGGPVWRHWLGLKKMFIYAAYEKYLQNDWQEMPAEGTVPTSKMLDGDFSELLTAGAAAQGAATCPSSPCPIMDTSTNKPYTDSNGNTIYYGSIFGPDGDVYPGNIMTDPISPRAEKVVALYKQYYQPTTAGVTNNFPILANDEPQFTQTQLSFKYDWDLSGSDHIAASYIYNLRPRTCTGPCGDAATTVLWQKGSRNGGPLTSGLQQTVDSNEYRINETHTFSPNLLNVVAYTFNMFQNKSVPMTGIAGATDWASQMGYGSIDPLNALPYVTFNGSPNGVGETTIGTNPIYGGGGYVAYNGILNDTLSWTKGRHNVKVGMEYRELGFNLDDVGGGMQFNFSSDTFAPTNSQIQPYVGSAFANFLLGDVQSADQGVAFSQDSRRKEMSFFGQDNIRVGRKLTVTAGLRWELTRPLHVLHGYWSNFDVDAPSQAFDGIHGAITWLAKPNGSFETYTDWHQFAPKLGIAYQVTRKLVARASGGMTYVPLGWNGYSGVPYGSAVGYTAVDQVLEVAPQSPAFQWDSSPYPGVYTPPTGPDPSSTYIPWGPANVDPHTRQLGFTENWYGGVEYQLPGESVLDVNYMGNSGRNLHDGALNPTNFPTWSNYSKLLNSGNEWDWVSDSGSAAAAGVPYPYPGFSGEAYFAINPYPQVQACYCGGVLFTNSPLGKSGYNAITVEGKKQHGPLNLDLSYVWSRQTGNTSTAFVDTYTFNYFWQNPYDYNAEARWAQTYDTVKGYATYSLPFGRGRRFLSRGKAAEYLAGGWTLGTIVSYGDAGDMGAVGSTNYYPGWSAVYTNVVPGAKFNNIFKRYDPGWNPTVGGAGNDPDSLFVNPANFTNPAWGELGNSPTVFTGQDGQPNWRGWATPQESGSLLKSTAFGPDGRYVMTLRAEFFNLFNRHYWDNPNTNLASAYFGHVTGVYGYRTGQLGARFTW